MTEGGDPDLWTSVKVSLEIDEPDEQKRKEMAKEAMARTVEKMSEPVIEDCHIVDKPIVTELDDGGGGESSSSDNGRSDTKGRSGKGLSHGLSRGGEPPQNRLEPDSPGQGRRVTSIQKIEPEPDAWRFKRYTNLKTSHSVEYHEKHPERLAMELAAEGAISNTSEFELVPDSDEPLYGLSTIRDTIERQEETTVCKCSACGNFYSDNDDAMDCCDADALLYSMIDKRGLQQAFGRRTDKKEGGEP